MKFILFYDYVIKIRILEGILYISKAIDGVLDSPKK